MPAPAPVVPRQMLPAPTTTAISTPRSRRASAISPAMRSTTPPSMVSSEADEANASPESFRTTRRRRGASLMRRSTAHDDLGELGDVGAAEALLHRLLLVEH